MPDQLRRDFILDLSMQLRQFRPVKAAAMVVCRVVAKIARKKVVPFVELIERRLKLIIDI
jgi:hypothetical protein